MKSVMNATVLFMLFFAICTAATTTVNINAAAVAPATDGVCFVRAGVVVHLRADGSEQTYSPTDNGILANMVACAPDGSIFFVESYGSFSSLMKTDPGVTMVERVTWPTGQFVDGLATTPRAILDLASDSSGNIVFLVKDSQDQVYIIKHDAVTGHHSIAGKLGQFGQFSNGCVANDSYYAPLNIGALTQVYEVKGDTVQRVAEVHSQGDGVLACTGNTVTLAYSDGNGTVQVSPIGGSQIAYQVPGTIKALAVAGDGSTIVVINDNGSKTYQLTGGQAVRLGNPLFWLAASSTKVAISGSQAYVASTADVFRQSVRRNGTQ